MSREEFAVLVRGIENGLRTLRWMLGVVIYFLSLDMLMCSHQMMAIGAVKVSVHLQSTSHLL